MKNDDLLMQIMMLDFAVQDSALFIDTHPCDKEAMNYFNEAATRLKAAKKEYQKQGHALVNREVGAYQNDYLSAPWPWVGDHKCRLRRPLNNAFTYRNNFEDCVQGCGCLFASFLVVVYSLVLIFERNNKFTVAPVFVLNILMRR